MEVSPKTLREVEFREKMRGYHPEDVDQFLEQVAAGIEVLQDRLRQAVDRAQRAEAAASESGGTDETLRKTLVLAQRTADMVVQEAREQASRILGSAEQQAQSIIADAEERGRRTLEETIAECKAELSRLESSRSQAQQDVETLHRWLDEHKEHLRSALTDALSAVDRTGILWPAPAARSGDGGVRRSLAPAAAPPPSPSPVAAAPEVRLAEPAADSGPETVLWLPPDAEGSGHPGSGMGGVTGPGPETSPSASMGSGGGLVQGGSGGGAAVIQAPEAKEISTEQALDDFFDDNGDMDGDARFGSRLRRRR